MKSRSLGTKLIVDGKVIGGLTSINGMDLEAEEVDLTALDNEDGFREKETNFINVSDVTGSGFLDGDDEAAHQLSMFNLLKAHTIVPCEVRFPAKIGLSWIFNASVKKFSTSVELEDGVKFDFALLPNKGGRIVPTEEAGSNCDLATLSIGSLTLSPAFDDEVTAYAATTSNATNTVTATAEDAAAGVVIAVNGNSIASGGSATWVAGANTVKITVTNGVNVKVYTVTVTKE